MTNELSYGFRAALRRKYADCQPPIEVRLASPYMWPARWEALLTPPNPGTREEKASWYWRARRADGWLDEYRWMAGGHYHAARGSASFAIDYTARLIADRCGFPKPFACANGVNEEMARALLSSAHEVMTPSAVPLAEENIIGSFAALQSRTTAGSELYAYPRHDQAIVGDYHVWWAERTWGILQRFGGIFPRSIGVYHGSNASFDGMLVLPNGRAIAIEIMAWSGNWRAKLQLAQHFHGLGIGTLFIGTKPPWVARRGEVEDVLLLHADGPRPCREYPDRHDSARIIEGPPGSLFLDGPELCDADGNLAVAEHFDLTPLRSSQSVAPAGGLGGFVKPISLSSIPQ